jgi:uncharacterized pyridoxal phosphate-dependent enzyme
VPNRRRFLQSLTSLPILGALLRENPALAAARKRNLLKELGVRPIINAAGTYTSLTASLMPPEVIQAWSYGARRYVRLDELHDAVGKRIAEMIGCEAAMVSAGAASALTLGTAACMTGTNQEFIRRLPDTAGMKTEVIIQKSHRFGYDHAVRNCGIRFVEVETREELEQAINDRTVMMLFLNKNEPAGRISASEFAEFGKRHNVPTFNDCAADVPPVENLYKYIKMGFSLVTFSGGKGICGPQSAGLLLGRRDLIQAARLNTSPNSDTIGRGMKVNKEELLAMMVAVELYLHRDHAADRREWEKRARQIAGSVSSIPGVQTEIQIPEIANHVPHLHIRWDRKAVKIAPPEVAQRLRDGEPPIEVVPGSREELVVGVWMMQPGDARIVGRRIQDVLKSAHV